MTAVPAAPEQKEAVEVDDETRLCTSCGLCCNALMHREAVLEQSEIGMARDIGLEILDAGAGQPRFALPCPLLRGTRCGVYPNRPRACATYRCKLLRRLEAGERTLNESLRTVGRAHDLIAAVAASTGKGGAGQDFWSELAQWADQSPEPNPVTRLDAAELLVLVRREFLLATEEA